MAEEKLAEEKEEVKKQRGRPKKAPVTPLVTEEPKRLMMTDDANRVTVNQIQNNLNDLYKRVFNISGSRVPEWLIEYDSLQRYNPFVQNKRLKEIGGRLSTMSRDDLIKTFENPSGSEAALRAQSQSLMISQYLYYKILRMAADVPMYKYYKTPEYLDESKYKSKEFQEEDEFVDRWLQTFDLPNTLKRTALEVKREGKATYLLRNCVVEENAKKVPVFATWQKLANEYVKLIAIGEKTFIASFNMLILTRNGYCPEMFPEYIQEIWYDLLEKGIITEKQIHEEISKSKMQSVKEKFEVDYEKLRAYKFDGFAKYDPGEFSTIIESSRNKKGIVNYSYWVPLPQDLCYTFCSDTSTPFVMPDTTGLFLGLKDLTDYDQLAGLLQSTPLTAILTAEMETIPNPNAGQDQTVMNPETICAFQDRFSEMSSSNVDSFFAPLKNFQLLTMPEVPSSSETTSNATKNFIYRGGLGGLIPVTDKPTVAQIKAAQYLQEAECDFVTKQFESVLNMIINKLLGNKFKWKLNIWGGIFTFSDEVRRDKELFLGGGSFVLPKIASAYNMSLRDVKAVGSYIDALEIYKNFKTVTQVEQEELAEAGTGAGRPETDDDDLENENTAASHDTGLDTAETR